MAAHPARPTFTIAGRRFIFTTAAGLSDGGQLSASRLMPSSPSVDKLCDSAIAFPRGDRIVLALAALLLAVQIGPWFCSQPDAVGYMSIARSIAHCELKCYGSPVLK